MKKVITNKNINAKRIQEIENYNLSLGSMVNINTRHKLKLNPIGVQVALRTLKELRAELEDFDIDIKEINYSRFFSNCTELTETEVFIKTICNHSYLNYRNDYNKIIQTKELDKDFPREERQRIADEIETEIKKEYRKITTVGKINKTLRRASEARIEELSRELRDILSTLEVPTEESINNRLYTIAECKLREIKNRLDYKISYLSQVMEEIE